MRVRKGRNRDLEKEVRWEAQLTYWVAGSPTQAVGANRHLTDVY